MDKQEETFTARVCSCGGEMFTTKSLKDVSPLALKYTAHCKKCGIWYETDTP